jgi:Catechol dioxygenase N terminus/Dioxygenase
MTFTEADLVNAVLDRLSDYPNPRFKTIMTALITHLHAFVRDVELTEEEWRAGIDFLTRTGRWPNGLEFILLSDILGVCYPLPIDGPAGEVLREMGRDAYHAAHLHLIVSAPGFEPVTTHLFVKGDRYIDEDAVFSVKDSLVVPFERHQPGTAPDRQSIDTAFYTAQYDFLLVPV